MAWVEPKTDWSNGDRCTAGDMARITGNLAYLSPSFTVTTSWTRNSILDTTQWAQIQSILASLINSSGIDGNVPDEAMTAQTFNDVEGLTLSIHDRIELNLRQQAANIYPSEYYAADVPENYVRGV